MSSVTLATPALGEIVMLHDGTSITTTAATISVDAKYAAELMVRGFMPIDSAAELKADLAADVAVVLAALPAVDPAVAGAPWLNTGVVTVSNGRID